MAVRFSTIHRWDFCAERSIYRVLTNKPRIVYGNAIFFCVQKEINGTPRNTVDDTHIII